MTHEQAHMRQMRSSVESIKETIETADTGAHDLLEDLAPLDVRAEISADGHLRGITVVVATGGPQIEIDLYDGMVRGYWGGDTASAHVDETQGLRSLVDYYELVLRGVEVQ